MSATTKAEKANEKKVAKVVTTPTGLPELEEGWVYHDLRNTNGVYAGKVKDETTFSVKTAIWAPIPVSPTAQGSVFQKYATPLTTPDGEFAIDGVQGAVARMVVQNYETIRGRLAQMAKDGVEVTPAIVQQEILKHEIFGGRRGGFRTVTASQDTLVEIMASGDVDRMAQYLKSLGAKVN